MGINFRPKLGGWLPDPKSEDEYWGFDKNKFSFNPESKGDVDLRPFSSPVHNQRSTSTCVGNAVVKALEIKRIQKYGHEKHENLSRLDVYYGARDLMNPKRTDVDSGTHISLACDVLRRFGVCREKMFPFDEKNLFIPPPVMATREAYLNKIHSHFRITTKGNDRLDDIILNLQAGNPVVFGTAIGENWFKYNGTEPIKQDTKFDGGHAMVVVGIINDLFIIENSWGCYDEETEVLTNYGWKYFKDLDGTEQFATLNMNDHTLEYQKSLKLHEYNFNGDLYHFKSQGVDLMVTPNHRMYVSKYRYKNNNGWHIKRADATKGRFCFKKNAANNTKDIGSFKIDKYEIPADIWLEFMGYFISEGSTYFGEYLRNRRRTKSYQTIGGTVRDNLTGKFIKNENVTNTTKHCTCTETYHEKYYTVSLSQALDENADTINNCLKQLPFNCREYRKNADVAGWKDQTIWTFTSKKLFNILRPLGKAHEKYIPREYLKLSQRQSKILLGALMLGDGTKKGNKFTYYTSSKQLANDIQELVLRCGYAADISVVDRTDQEPYTQLEYQIGIKRKRTSPESNHKPTLENYTGKVYCATVPNGLLYVRRNGQATWCGNSNWGLNGFAFIEPEILKANETRDLWVLVDGSEAYFEKGYTKK